MFCVRCGKEVGDATLVGGVCADCYLEENALVSLPETVNLNRCVHCGARQRGEQWVEMNTSLEAALSSEVREAVVADRRVRDMVVNVQMTAQDERNFHVDADVSGVSEGIAFRRHLTTRARLKGGTCLRCSRMTGGYFEAILQIRASRRDMTRDELRKARGICSRIIDRIVGDGDKNAFVLKDEEMHGGLDVTVGTNNSAKMMVKALLSEFGATVTESARLAGVKDGNDIYRITYSVRIPEYALGDAVVLEDKVQIVQSVNAKKVTLRDPGTGRVRTQNREDVDEAQILPRAEAKDAVVVADLGAELQVLDPWTYATVNVIKPADFKAGAETVQVLRWDDDLVVLPA